MPWTGGAFLVGSLAIAGVPPLNGFASEWLTLQALVHVPAYGGLGDGLAGAVALAALAATAALAVFCFVKVVGLVLLGPPRRDRRSPTRSRRPCRCARRSSRWRAPASCSASCPGLLVGSLARLAPWPAYGPDGARLCICPAPGRCRRSGSRSCSALLVPALVAAARTTRRGAGADLGVRPARGAAARAGRAPASRSRCGSCSRRCCARSGRSRCARRAASCRRSPTAAASRI